MDEINNYFKIKQVIMSFISNIYMILVVLIIVQN